MYEKGKAAGIETRGISNHKIIHSIYFRDPNGCHRADRQGRGPRRGDGPGKERRGPKNSKSGKRASARAAG